MGTIRDLLDNAKFVRDNMQTQSDSIVARNKNRILDLNRESQIYEKGIDNSGNRLDPYSSFTVAIKRGKGEVFNRTTLFDKGDFYSGFDYLFKNNQITIFSRDTKSGELVDKYGNIFGLTDENQYILNYEIVKPELIDFIKKYIG